MHGQKVLSISSKSSRIERLRVDAAGWVQNIYDVSKPLSKCLRDLAYTDKIHYKHVDCSIKSDKLFICFFENLRPCKVYFKNFIVSKEDINGRKILCLDFVRKVVISIARNIGVSKKAICLLKTLAALFSFRMPPKRKSGSGASKKTLQKTNNDTVNKIINCLKKPKPWGPTLFKFALGLMYILLSFLLLEFCIVISISHNTNVNHLYCNCKFAVNVSFCLFRFTCFACFYHNSTAILYEKRLQSK